MFPSASKNHAGVERKSLFPAYGAVKVSEDVVPADSSTSNHDVPDSFAWLQNSSYTRQNAEVLQTIQMGVAPDMDEDENEKHDEPVDIAEIYKQIEAKHRKHKKKLNRKRKSSKRSRTPSPEKLNRDGDCKKIFLEEVRLAPEHAFRVDRNSDRNIVVFGAFAPIQVPQYRRNLRDILGQNSESGFFPWWKDTQTTSKKRKKKDKQFERYHRCTGIWRNETNVLDLSGPSKIEFPGDTCRHQYLPIERDNSDSKTSAFNPANATSNDVIDTNPLGVYDKNTNLYFQGKGAANPTTSKSQQSEESGHGPYRETHEQYLTRMTVDFNRYLRENPGDVRRWIDFVSFQHAATHVNQFGPTDAVTGGGGAVGAQKKMAESALLEKQLAIVDRALVSNSAAVELLVLKFNLCKDTWEADRLAREWKRVVFVHPNDTWLCRQYLRFFQTTFSMFKVTKYTSLYGKCFATLKRIHAGTFQSHKAKPHLEEDMIDIFSDYCHVLLQSGYHEKAIASFQALIEYNFFAPETLTSTTPVENWMAFFEPFWDSGKPRFGDRGAKGWSDTMKNRHQEHVPEPLAIEQLETDENIIKADEPRWRNWLSLEQGRVRRHWLPWLSGNARQQQEDECEDPDRMVLFDDVEPSLFRLRMDDCRFTLLLRFMFMLGVRMEPHLTTQCQRWHCHDPRFVDDLNHIVDERGWHLFRWRFHQCGHVNNVFEVESQAHRATRTNREFIDDVFRQSLPLFADQPERRVALVTLWVQHRCLVLDSLDSKSGRNQLKEVKRLLKTILKEPGNRNNLCLWKTYATLEWISGNSEEARKIFYVALSTHSPVVGNRSQELAAACDVYATYAELELGVGFGRHTDRTREFESWAEICVRVAWLLANLANDAPTASPPLPLQVLSTTTLLKARRQYQLMMDALLAGDTVPIDSAHASSGNENEDANYSCRLMVSWTICYGMFEYVTEGLAAAEAVFSAAVLSYEMDDPVPDQPCSEFGSEKLHSKKFRRETDLELLYMHYVQLHVLHSNKEPSASITNVRRVLQNGLKRFPENEHFNQLFLDIEAKSHIAGRIRAHYNQQLRDGGAIGRTAATYSILAELERQNNLLAAVTNLPAEFQAFVPTIGNETGVTNRLHSLFERIVCHKDLENCVLLWRLYMKFEVMQRKKNEAKAIFYRAIRQCPAAKVLYMDAIEYFPGDVQEIDDILTEKEIRVRIPLEEVDLLAELNFGTKLSNSAPAIDQAAFAEQENQIRSS